MSVMSELKFYAMRIDGPLFRSQRLLLLRLVDTTFCGKPYAPPSGEDRNLFDGIIELLDEIADQAHDRHGIDCLLDGEAVCDDEENDTRCECEKPGYFCSGVPGIIARMENGRMAKGASVNRCDLCQRYPSDEAAFVKLWELGHVPQ